jgi:iron(III) transport system ATP-binding protein
MKREDVHLTDAKAEFVNIGHLSKTFGAARAVQDVSFAVARGTVVSLLGPSGCGKTTVLRCVAGLETPTSGTISIGGVIVSDVTRGIQVPPDRRSIGMVFQSYAIWPHMTVFENVSFPLKLRKESRRTIQEKVRNILDLVGLADFADRPATNLSGGQQQRVALARALVAEPQLVLFDEPLSNLDAKLRERMRVELLGLQKRLGFTAIYVTHDQQEALALSDRLVIMNTGVIEQQGDPMETYKNPRTAFVADFMGASNLIKGHVVERKDPPYVTVQIDGIDARVTCQAHELPAEAMTPVMVSFRPGSTDIVLQEGTTIADLDRSGLNRLPAQVNAALFLGEHYEYSVRVGEALLKANCRSIEPFPTESLVYILVGKENCLAIPVHPSR